MEENEFIDSQELQVDDLLPKASGTGNVYSDYYISQRLALMAPDLDRYSDAVGLTLDTIASMSAQEIRESLRGTIESNEQSIKDMKLDLYSLDQASEAPVTSVDEAVEDIQDSSIVVPNTYEKVVSGILEQLNAYPSPSIAREAARIDAMNAIIYERMQELGVETDPGIGSFLGAMIPGRNLVDLGTGIKYENYVRWFTELSEEEQFRNLIDVIDSVFAETKNPILGIERLAPFLNYSDISEIKAALAFDVVDVATILPFTKLIKVIKGNRTAAKVVRNAGRPDLAAKIVHGATSSEKAADNAGMAIDDAILSTSPFANEGIDPLLVSDVSADVQKIIAEGQVSLMEKLAPLHDDTILKRRVWTDAEVQESIKKHTSTFAGKARLLKEVDDGTLWEVEVVRKSDILENQDSLINRLEVLEARLVQGTDIDLPEMLANAEGFGKDAIKAKKQEILDTKQELGRLREILKIDTDKDNLLVRLEIALRNNPDEALNKDAKEIRRALADNKLRRTRIASKLKTRVIETPEIEQRVFKFTEDDFGNLASTEITPGTSQYLNSPSSYLSGMHKGLISTARNIDFTKDQIRGVFQDAYASVFKKLSRKERRVLDDILLQGDVDQVTYSSNELLSGVRTPSGILKMNTAEELSAYYQTRRLADELYVLKNQELRRKLEIGGYKSISIQGKPGFANVTKATEIVPSGIKAVYDTASDTFGAPRQLLPGEKVYRLRKPVTNNDRQYNYIIAKDEFFQELPSNVIEYRRGYVPKVRENIFFVAEKITNGIVDGARSPIRTVVRFFDNPKDVATWEQKVKNSKTKFQVRSTSQWFEENPQSLDDWEEMMFGGTYEGDRTDNVIPFNLGKTDAERMGALESLEAYMNHISTRLPAVDFRAALVRRFENSAVDPITKESWLNKSGDWRDKLAIPTTHPSYAGMTAMQKWVKAQLSIPTTEERMFHANVAMPMARLAAKLPKIGDRISSGVLKLSEKNLVGVMRTTAFHATLGFLNPAQLVVQSMGAATAFALDPLGAPVNLSKYLALRLALSIKDPRAWKKAAEAAGEDADNFAQMVNAYNRSGLHQSVRSTADYGTNSGFFVNAASIRNLADKGLVFFREGERFVRGYAWVQAWRKLVPPGTKITDELIDKVTNESVRYTLDLNRANKARWQSGALSIPTQFMQITTKFVENALYKGGKLEGGWTAAEKARVAAAQIVLFGAAGVPAGNWALSNAIGWLKDDGEFGLGIKDPALLTVLSGGVAEAAIYWTTGEAPAFSERVSIPFGIEQIFDRLTDEDATTLEIMAGVFGEVPKRGMQSLGHLVSMYGSVLQDPENMELSVLGETADDLAQIVSTWRNIRKAYAWEKANAILTNKGEKIDFLTEDQKRTIVLGKIFGIDPKQVGQYYDIVEYNRRSEEYIKQAVDDWFAIIYRYGGSNIMQTEAGRKRLSAMIAMTTADLTEAQKQKVAERISEKMGKDDYKITKELLKMINNAMALEGDVEDLETNTLVLPRDE